MRIGIVPNLNPSGGGVYQYSLSVLHSLDRSPDLFPDDEFVIFAQDLSLARGLQLKKRSWTILPLLPVRKFDSLRRLVGEGPHRTVWRWLRRRASARPAPPATNRVNPDPDRMKTDPEMNQWFRQCQIDLMVYLFPDTLTFEAGMPYVVAIHDLQHQLQPEFPEVSADGEWERREYLFRNAARHATMIMADSEVGREDVLNFYGHTGLQPEQVKALPYLPASYLALDINASERARVRKKYQLPPRYLFYPAQFWSHKNHQRIVEALSLLKQEHNLIVDVVFCGSHTGAAREQTFAAVQATATELGVTGQIHYVGFLPDPDMSAMYAEAVALVMPTFFGPTNIPPMEAWAFGCPVLTSDIRGIREHSDGAALLVDPRSANAIAAGIRQLWTDEQLRHSLVAQGHRRLAGYTPDDFQQRLVNILKEAKERVRQQPGTMTSIRKENNGAN